MKELVSLPDVTAAEAGPTLLYEVQDREGGVPLPKGSIAQPVLRRSPLLMRQVQLKQLAAMLLACNQRRLRNSAKTLAAGSR